MEIAAQFITNTGFVISLLKGGKTKFYATYHRQENDITTILSAANNHQNNVPFKWLSYPKARERYNSMIRYSNLLTAPVNYK